MDGIRFVMLLAALVVGFALAGCPRVDDPVVETGKNTAVPPEAAPSPVVSAAEEPKAPAMERRAVVTKVEIVGADEERAEDGRGGTIAAARPVAIEITAEAWPVRALDPVLHVGDLEFRHYTFPRLNVLRYVAADRALLPAGAAAWIQYGDDAASRIEVAGSLEVPR
ncbi:MAG: hypothetical protein M0R80_20660 [Proteobacteria bacterium]|jgi:hypothetical protein|nr:hypothetical protein [Pseudomonadota bacterium]